MKITKRQLRRIIREEKAKVLAEQKVRRVVRRRLTEIVGGSPPVGGAPALGKDKMVVADSGAYALPSPDGNEAYTGAYVTDSEDHPLDQLQDILDMGVKLVDDADGMSGVRKIEDWMRQVVDVASDPAEEYDDIYGPPTRWKG